MPQLIQRQLTVEFIAKRRLDAQVVWLRPEAATASTEDAVKAPSALQCDPNEWLDERDDRNLGARLADGWIELKIKSPDDVWVRGLFKAVRDARAAFGNPNRVSSILFKIDDPQNIDRWRDLWPRGHKDKSGQWVATEFEYSLAPTRTSKPIWRDSSPLPGSKFANAIVCWRPNGKPEADIVELGLEDLESRPIPATSMESICRAIAFATLSYWIEAYLDGLTDWDESLVRTIGGWIARVVNEGRDINARGKSLEGVCWSPVDDVEHARHLITYLGGGKPLLLAYEHAASALERNPQAPVPGWGAIETLFGPQAKVGIRRAFRAGIDIDLIEQMSDRYVYDTGEHIYLDRDELLQGLSFRHSPDDLKHQWANELIYLSGGKKPLNPFAVYSTSQLRADVKRNDFYPGHEPGAVLRFSPLHGLLTGEDQHPDEYKLLNTFPGFVIKPTQTVDKALMSSALSMLDRVLGLLTRDNDAQMLWLKKFTAHLVRFPEEKPQICPIIVGGQGIGKSVFGENVMKALVGRMAGQAQAADLSDNKFLITPFIGKLITFIDEVKLESVSAINIIKKLVRSDHVSGQIKFGHQKDFYIPSRLMIASNSPDIGLTPADAADRAFFFIVSWTSENKRMTDREFQEWSASLKPFYTEFMIALEKVEFRQHLMRYFRDIEVTRMELEDLTHSSRNDENVVRSTMSKARSVARAIVADARVTPSNDIVAWFSTATVREAIKRVDGARSKVEAPDVLMEWERAGVIERKQGDLYAFKWGYGLLLQKLGDAHNLPIAPNWPIKPGEDWEPNGTKSQFGAPSWRGNKAGHRGQREAYDPDYMPPES